MTMRVALAGGPAGYDGATIANVDPDITGHFWLGSFPEAWYRIDGSTGPADTLDGRVRSARYVGDHKPDGPPDGTTRAYYEVVGVRMVEEAIRRLAAEPGFHVSRLPGFDNRKTIRVDSPDGRVPNAILRTIDPRTRQVPAPDDSVKPGHHGMEGAASGERRAASGERRQQ
jgi:hypothetical protein